MQIKREWTLCASRISRTSVPGCSRIWCSIDFLDFVSASSIPKTLFDGSEWLCLCRQVQHDGGQPGDWPSCESTRCNLTTCCRCR